MNPADQPFFQSWHDPNVQGTPSNFSGSGLYSSHITVSAAFPRTHVFGGAFPDLELVSSEKIVHYVHRQQLCRVSLNSFAGLLTDAALSIPVVEPALVLSIVLHTVYGMPSTHHNLPLNTIEAAIDALVKYGVAVHLFATPSGPLYPLLLLHAPHHPIDAYAVAGKYRFEDAAVAISAHLLAYDLFLISDELSIKMGPVYLRRLIDLHSNRATALKGIVLRPPEAHPPTATCGGAMQGWLTQAWVFAAAQLAWDTLPSMSADALQSTFEKAGREITCENCKAALRARIQEVCWQWSKVKRTI